MTKRLALLALGMLAACASYEPRPLDPLRMAEAYEARTLDDPGLHRYLVRQLPTERLDWPLKSWSFQELTLAAFYYSPELDVARAKWATSRAGIETAAAVPNPTLQIPSEYATNAPRGESPVTLGLGLDIPIETAGKRGYRIRQASELSTVARRDVGSVAWRVRSRLRRSLLELASATHAATVLERQVAAEHEVVAMLEKRLAVGAASATAVNAARIELTKEMQAHSKARARADDARTQVAAALGVPVSALAGVDLDLHSIERSEIVLPLADAHRQALLNRADVQGALAEYEASQAALQLEIARQYPDVHIGPGYVFDAGLDKLALPVSGIALPIFDRNEGPIAQAEARRREVAAHVNAVQASALDEMDSAVAGYESARRSLALARTLLRAQRSELTAARRSFNAGETDRLALTLARHALFAGELDRDAALLAAQQAVGRLEDAMQRPLTGAATKSPAGESAPWEDDYGTTH